MAELLPRLNLTADQAARLPRKLRADVAELLVRWHAFAEADALLALWPHDDMVSTLDLRARVASGLGRHAEAAALMEQRLAQKSSTSAQGLRARLLLQSGNAGATVDAAHALIEGNRGFGTLWSLLGDAYFQLEALDEAEAAYLEHRSLAPNSRQPDLGLARVALGRRDPVTATAFAVRALTLEGVDFQPTVEQLLTLRDLFAALGEQNHLADVEQQLDERLESEVADLLVLLEDPGLPTAQARDAGQAGDSTPRRARARRPAGPSPEPPAPAVAPAPPLDSIAVQPDSLARFAGAAQQLFGFSELRPAQAEILACVERDEDVLAVLPTGAGKSLTYQLSAFLDGDGPSAEALAAPRQPLTLVISPLIALMKDQVEGLPAALQPYAIALNSSYEGDRLRAALHDLRRGRYRLLYVAPERLRQRAFLDLMQRRGVRRLVIDEAHCVSVWGHNFRPDYLYIAQAHRELGAPPVMALTATAPPRVREDIEQRLFTSPAHDGSGRALRRIALDSYRPNLLLGAIKVKAEPDKRALLVALCERYAGSGIVYARSRQKCEELAALLREQGHDAAYYHAGMGDAERAAAQERFMTGATRIIVATVAFGMGVDKPDIRFIIHFGLPSSLEAYYQEAGRAGRDGAPAHCVLLHAASDKSSLTALARQDAVTIDLLRSLYRAIRTGTRGAQPAALAAADLQRETGLADTPFRVALSMLEQAGMITRFDDVPVTINLRLPAPPADPALRAFAQAAALQPGFWAERGFMELAAATGSSPALLERTLLEWQAAGLLDVQSSGRTLLLQMLPPPPDAEKRIQGLLGRIEAVQHQQAAEIYAYAQTRRCRHVYLSAYLDGKPGKRCGHCDNCGGMELPSLDGAQPGEQEIETAILRALSERPLGRLTLLRVLMGDANRLDERYKLLASYRTLQFVRGAVIEGHIEALAARRLVERHEYDSGAAVYKLTDAGWRVLRAAGAPRRQV